MATSETLARAAAAAWCGAFGRRRRWHGISAWRIDLRRAAAGEHTGIGVRPDHGNRFHGRRAQRQLAARVLQQHRALFRDPLGHFEAAENVHHFGRGRQVEKSHRELRAQDAVNHVVDARQRDRPAIHRLLERVSEIIAAWHFDVQPGERRFGSGMSPAPVGKHEALKAECLLQHVGQQVAVLAGPIGVDLVVGAHDRAGARILDADLEGQQVAFAHGALVENHVADVAARFLVVKRVVLDIPDDALGLQGLHLLPDEPAGQDRILAFVLEETAVARLSREVDAAAERHVESLVAQLAADECAVFVGQLGVPTGGFGNRGGQRGGVAAARRASRDSDSRVGHL